MKVDSFGSAEKAGRFGQLSQDGAESPAPRLAVYHAADEEWTNPLGEADLWNCVLSTSDWRTFEHASARVECAIAVIRWLEGDDAFGRLRTRRPACPVLLVTTKDADNLRALRDVAVEELSWIDASGPELVAAITRARARSFLRLTAERIERADHLPATLRNALAHAFRAERPPVSVEELGRASGRNRRTLWYHWNEAMGGEGGLRLLDLLHWLLVLHAVNRKAAGWKWMRVADDLGVSEQTVWSAVRRLLNVDRRQLADAGPAWVQERFEREVLPLLLREPLDRN